MRVSLPLFPCARDHDMATLSQSKLELTDNADHAQRCEGSDPLRRLRVYMMDMWSFIPYYVARLTASLAGEFVDVTLGSVRYHLDRDYFHKAGLKPDRMLLDTGGRFKSHSLRRLTKSCEYLANLSLLALRFSVSKPDILHVQYMPFLERRFWFEMWFLRWVRRRGIPIVYTAHNVTRQDRPGEGRDLYRRVYHSVDALICHGEDARRELIQDFGVNEERIWIIPHGPLFDDRPQVSPQDARVALGLPVDEPLVLLLGVISEYKGVPFLLDAWRRFKQAGGRGHLLVAGTGDAGVLTKIQEKVAAEKLESVELRLSFVPVEQLPLLHEAADILVYPYSAGTTSGALLTGLKYGKAMITTRLPFFKEHLEDGKTAVMVDYGDCDALAASLLDLTRRPDERQRLGNAQLRQSSQEVTWDEIAKKTRACYESVLNSAR